MKLLILQISDIHFKSDKLNRVTTRPAMVVQAVRELASSCDSCIVLVTGDVAYSGKASEYAVASSFFDDLKSRLQEVAPNSPIQLIFVAGNHDCYFDEKLASLRSTLVDAVLKDVKNATDPAFLDVCTEPQSEFLSFRSRHAPPAVESSLLATHYRIEVGGYTVAIRCLNTAWLSQKQETPGRLVFPPDECVHLSDSSVVITALHHPTNWLEPTNGRAIRAAIEGSSDLIFTGHEHEAGAYSKSTAALGTHNDFIEGAVFQDWSDQSQSGFNTALVDLKDNSIRVEHFSWKEEMYRATATDERFSST